MCPACVDASYMIHGHTRRGLLTYTYTVVPVDTFGMHRTTVSVHLILCIWNGWRILFFLFMVSALTCMCLCAHMLWKYGIYDAHVYAGELLCGYSLVIVRYILRSRTELYCIIFVKGAILSYFSLLVFNVILWSEIWPHWNFQFENSPMFNLRPAHWNNKRLALYRIIFYLWQW